jgi:hypothetical protein
MVLGISVAMVVGFVLGRISRRDLEQEERAGDFTAPPIAPIPHPTDQIEPPAPPIAPIPHPTDQIEPNDGKLNWAPYD